GGNDHRELELAEARGRCSQILIIAKVVHRAVEKEPWGPDTQVWPDASCTIAEAKRLSRLHRDDRQHDVGGVLYIVMHAIERPPCVRMASERLPGVRVDVELGKA